MKKEIISTSDAPKALGPYSQAFQVGGFIFCSGQIALDPSSGDRIPGGVEQQTRQVLENLKNVLEAAGSSLDRVVKTTVYLQDRGEFDTMNQVYAEYFKENPPARATIEVSGLPKDVAVEIECIAYA